MNVHAIDYVSSWLDHNIDCEAVGAADCLDLVDRRVAELMRDARDSGVDISAEFGINDIRAAVRRELRSRTDSDIDRLIRKP